MFFPISLLPYFLYLRSLLASFLPFSLSLYLSTSPSFPSSFLPFFPTFMEYVTEYQKIQPCTFNLIDEILHTSKKYILQMVE